MESSLRLIIFRRNKSGQLPKSDEGGGASSDQAVIINLRLSDDSFGTDEERQRVLLLEDQIIEVVDRAGVGVVDGPGFGDGVAEFFVHGPDAEAVFAAIENLVRAFNPATGSSVLLMFGSDDDARVRTIALG